MEHLPNKSSAFTAWGETPIGRPAESRAVMVMRGLLTARGHIVEDSSATDEDGEDAGFQIDGVEYDVQVTSIPDAPNFWREVKRHGSAITHADAEHAANWLQHGISKKTDNISEAQRANTILVLDAHDWSAELADPGIVGYLEYASSIRHRDLGWLASLLRARHPATQRG